MELPKICLTVDVEDWHQSSWDRNAEISDYSEENARKVLRILDDFPQSKATFFILGKFAEKYPKIVKDIQTSGHEIGSHGWGHIEVFRQNKESFREDIKKSTEVLSEICGQKPVSYRAPDFSITGESLWALEILAEYNYLNDSSIFPIAKKRYGIPNWPAHSTKVQLTSNLTINEHPITTIQIFGKRLPVGGGGYARLLPSKALRIALTLAYKQNNTPPVFYCHPYEFDPEEFHKTPSHIPFGVRLHQGLGRKNSERKLREILSDFVSITVFEAAQTIDKQMITDYKDFEISSPSIKRPNLFNT